MGTVARRVALPAPETVTRKERASESGREPLHTTRDVIANANLGSSGTCCDSMRRWQNLVLLWSLCRFGRQWISGRQFTVESLGEESLQDGVAERSSI